MQRRPQVAYEQFAFAQHLGLPARLDDHRRASFADNRRSHDPVAGRELAAVEELRVDLLAGEPGGRDRLATAAVAARDRGPWR